MVVLGWLACIGLAFWVVYGINIQDIIEYDGISTQIHPPSHTFNLVYTGLSKVAWATSMAWIVFACEKGYGGINICFHPIYTLDSFFLFE